MKYIKWIFLFAGIFAVFLYWQLFTPASKGEDPIYFEIAPASPFTRIAAALQEKKLVRNEFLLRVYARATGLDSQVKAGRFRLDPNLSPVMLLNFLTHPEYGEISVTIPEGFSVFEIDKKLVTLGVAEKGDFLSWASEFDVKDFPFIPAEVAAHAAPSRLEGYLFPDTYLVFARNFMPEDLGLKMLQNFKKKVEEGLGEDIKVQKRSLREIVIMASILEKEIKNKQDYHVTAGLLWKRLENNWPLQTDATILYGKEDRSISADELQEDSPYNTYTRQGLPAGPIGNPGLDTIKAALSPVESPYWFYITDSEGRTLYAKTDEEHEKNKREFLYK